MVNSNFVLDLESAGKKSEDLPSPDDERDNDEAPETSFTIDDGPHGAVVITNMGHIPVPSPPPGITDTGFV